MFKGYAAVEGTLKSRCLLGDAESDSTLLNEVYVSIASSTESLAKALNVEVGIGIELSGIGVSDKTTFFKSLNTTTTSVSATVRSYVLCDDSACVRSRTRVK
ncbi:unnamed protein product [Symbiodinium sp. CCMP2592]|nr:unnamed protein product [Symbiodinium sp. CCMP2592]